MDIDKLKEKAKLTDDEIEMVWAKWNNKQKYKQYIPLYDVHVAIANKATDKAFSTVIKETEDCPTCGGLKVSNPDDEPLFWKDCSTCKGTGQTPPVTVMDAVEKVRNE